MAKVLVTIICVFFLRTVASQSSYNQDSSKNLRQENVVPLPVFDSIGSIVTFLDLFLSQSTSGLPPPKSSNCERQLVDFGSTKIIVSQQPRGNCSYCCPVNDYAKYVTFYFTNKARGGQMVEIKMKRNRGNLQSAGVDRTLPTVIYIHGFIEHGKGTSAKAIINAYLSKDQAYNIILLDWGEFSAFPWYRQAVEHTKMVGVLLTRFIRFYNQTGELPIANLHLVGFSLGAHMSGYVGKAFADIQKIPRITALDPAQPLYSKKDSSAIITKHDAEFVDVIHTDPQTFGFPSSLGHADFYPNGGSAVQPGCNPGYLAQQYEVERYIWCNHVRAWNLYAESVKNPKAFPATKCGIMHKGSLKECGFITDAYMGFEATKGSASGDYFLTTNNRPPFGKSAKEQEANIKRVNLIL